MSTDLQPSTTANPTEPGDIDAREYLKPCAECGNLTDEEELIRGCCPPCAHQIAYANAAY